MPDYTGGFTSALNDISSRKAQDTRTQQMLQQMTQTALDNQQKAADRASAEKGAIQGIEQLTLENAPPDNGPQPPPPGQSSMPMIPPPAAAAPPPPMPHPSPMPGMAGGLPTPAAGMAPPSAPIPQGGMQTPPAAAIPPQGWKSSPVAPPHLGGPPPGGAQPGPSSGMPPPAGGLPPPQAGAAPPPAAPAPGAASPMPGAAPGAGATPGGIDPQKTIDIKQFIGDFMKGGKHTPMEAYQAAVQMLPFINAHNEQILKDFGAQAKIADQTIRYQKMLMDQYEKEKRTAQGEEKLGQGRDALDERSTHDRAMEKAAMIRANRTGGGAGGSAPSIPYDKLSPEQQKKVDFYAAQSLKGSNEWRVSQGRSPQGRALMSQVLDRLPDLAAEKGMGPDDAAMAIAEFQGAKAGERTLGTRSATVGMASNEASSLADLALDASEKVSRTDVKSINDAVQKVQKGTASPELRAFTAANTSLINAYARAINPQGVGTVADKEHARDMLDTAFSKGDYASTVHQLLKEIDAAKASPKSVKAEMREGFTGKKAGGSPPPTNGKGWKLMKDKHGNSAYVSPDKTQYEAVPAQ